MAEPPLGGRGVPSRTPSGSLQPFCAEMPRILPFVGTSSFSNSTSSVKTPTGVGFAGFALMSKIERLFVLVT